MSLDDGWSKDQNTTAVVITQHEADLEIQLARNMRTTASKALFHGQPESYSALDLTVITAV